MSLPREAFPDALEALCLNQIRAPGSVVTASWPLPEGSLSTGPYLTI